MSSDAHIALPMYHSEPGQHWPQSELPDDPILFTAGDRPNTATLPVLPDPAADHDVPTADPLSRRADIEAKHATLIEFLDRNGYDAILLARADSIAWFTSGADLPRDLASERAAVMLFINHQNRAVICDNVQSARVFEEEIAGLGFQIKERPWHEEPERIIRELAHNKKVAADVALPPGRNELPRLRGLRLCLSKRDRQVLRQLGRTMTLAVEATCRNFMPGETEADVAGHLAHRLIREGIVPVDLRIASDDRLARFRQPSFKSAPIRNRAMVAVVGRRLGLCAGLTRTVAFGPISPEVRMAHQLASMVSATYTFFSRPGELVCDVFRRAKRIYEKFGRPDEWLLDYQGSLTGYAPTEGLLMPDGKFHLENEMALRWHPSVGPVRCEDTIVIDERGFEVVTGPQVWPTMEVSVKGFPMSTPAIFERPPQG